MRYANGRGLPVDLAEAARWYRLAAERSGREAQFNLGMRHVRGQGATHDRVTGMLWVSLASRQGHPEAQIVRDRLSSHLTPAQHEQLRTLLPIYAARYGGGTR